MIKRAFTLIELIVVMAITAVLLTLIIFPLFQSFNITRAAQAFADAQDRARVITERLAGEIGSAASVRSGAGTVRTTYRGVADVALPQSSLIVQVPAKDGTIAEIALAYTKLDIIEPAEGEAPLNGDYINPNNGLIDPTLQSPKGQVSIPVIPGQTIKRLFIGLRDPLRDYNNPYDGQLMAKNVLQDNLYVMYSAEVQPILTGGVVNTAYFEADVDGKPILDDPRFFVPNRTAGGVIITNDAKAERIKNWLGLGGTNVILPQNIIRRAVVLTEVSRYDMIQTQYSQAAKSIVYDGIYPRITPLVQFRPAHVSNEPARGEVAARLGEESTNSAAEAPSIYSTDHNLWDHAIVRNWPRGWSPADPNANSYSIARGDELNGLPNQPAGTSIYVYDPDLSPTDFNSGVEVFDLEMYDKVASNVDPLVGLSRYPFSQAVNAANTRSGWFGSQSARDFFVPFTLNSSKGRVRTSFSITEVGDPNIWPPVNANMPTLQVANNFTPLNDPDVTGNFYNAKYNDLNARFNKTWVDRPNLQPNIQRFIDARVITNGDGSISPLDPTNGFSRASITPGTDELYGPDQSPGNYGQTIRYTRTTRAPGPNQYRINYVDLPEPRNDLGNIDYSLLGLTPAQIGTFDPNVYDRKNFVSAIIQPRFKKGYIQLNSDPNYPLPVGTYRLSYQFQFNCAGASTGAREDIFAVDYDTRQLIDVLLTMRNYPQSDQTPQSVTLKSTAAVRNYVR
ncbi:hypothetical protein BH11ARM1_BH11ARM1_07690 [soil metagenome]